MKSLKVLSIGALLALGTPALAQSGSSKSKLDDSASNAGVKVSTEVGITVNRSNNILEDRGGQKATYTDIAPKLSISGGLVDISLGGEFRRFADSEIGDQDQYNTFNADAALNFKMNNIWSNTTKVGVKYQDDRDPNWITSERPNSEYMPIRYLDTKIGTSFKRDTKQFGFSFGGSYTKRNGDTVDSDYAQDLLNEEIYNISRQEFVLEGSVDFKMNKNHILAIKPKIKRRTWDEREARLEDGTSGGESFETPKHETTSQSLTAKLTNNFSRVKLNTELSIGMQIDEVFGGEDYSNILVGESIDFIVYPAANLKISPNVSYERISFDNYTYQVPNGLRVDEETIAGISISGDINKNFSANLALNHNKYESTRDIQSINFSEDVVSTGLTLKF